ncbi:MAG: hypothetical protein ABMB14_29775 [Myxococcota bacterium]
MWLALSCRKPEPRPSDGDATATGDTATPSIPDAPTSGSTGDTAAPPPGPCGVLADASPLAGPGEEFLQTVAFGADGGSFVGGYLSGTLMVDPGGPAETTLDSAPGADGFVIRYAPDGSVQWAVSIVAPELVVPTAEGGLVAVGGFYGAATFGTGPDAVTLDSVGESDGWVARLDAEGAVRWAVRFGGSGYDFATGVALADGDVVVTGSYGADATFGAGGPEAVTLVLPPFAITAGFVARFDEDDGAVDWADPVGGTQYALVDRAAVDPVSGEILVTGVLNGPGVTTIPGDPPIEIDPVGAEGFLGWWNPTGAARAVVTHGGSADDLVVGPDGSVTIAGAFYGEVVFGAGEPGETTLSTVANSDLFVARFGPDGAVRWAAQSEAQPVRNAWGRALAATVDDGVVVTGDFTGALRLGAGGPAEITFPGDDDSTAYLARFDRTGDLVCAVAIAGRPWAFGTDADRRPDGTFTALTTVQGAATLAPGTPSETEVPPSGGMDGVISQWTF